MFDRVLKFIEISVRDTGEEVLKNEFLRVKK